MIKYVEVGRACPKCGGQMWLESGVENKRLFQWEECESCGHAGEKNEIIITVTDGLWGVYENDPNI